MKTYDGNGKSERMSLSAPDTQLEMAQLNTRPRVELGFIDRLRSDYKRRNTQDVEDNEMDDASSEARRRINQLRIEHFKTVAEAIRLQKLFSEAMEKTAQSVKYLRRECYDRIQQNTQWFESQKKAMAEMIGRGEMSEECGQRLLDEARELLIAVSHNDKQRTNAMVDYQNRLAAIVQADDDGPKSRRR